MTNPSTEQIEAAARAIANTGLTDTYPWERLGHPLRSLHMEEARAALTAAAGVPASGSTSDGHHTFDELYDYRMLYNAHAARGWLAAGIPVVKSWKHSDGDLCFGGGWFIVTATLPTGQVSNHYKAEHWGLFAVPEVVLPPEYDGHTPDDAAERLRAAAGVTPREPGVAKASYISPSLPGMIRNLWKSDPSENSVRTALKLAGDLIQELIDIRAAPVQVDEAKLDQVVITLSGPFDGSEGLDSFTLAWALGKVEAIRGGGQ